jgi:hypothetical protein
VARSNIPGLMTLLPAGTQARGIRVAPGRVLQATPVFDTYWRFACARQQVFHRRVAGDHPPWTDDPVIANYRFTNAYRASDRVSQFLVREVLYSGEEAPDEVFFRAMLFKIFNRIDTWQALRARMGVISWRDYNFEAYAVALDEIMARGSRIYSGAYIMPSPAMGCARKHRNHLLLLEQMLHTEAPKKIMEAPSLEAVFRILLGYPSLGPFLAFQFAIDLNYSALCSFSEMDYVVAGPGARDGIRKCFSDTAGLNHEDVIRAVTERAAEEFARLDLHFDDLWGRSLQLVDCQNLFCEVDKYSRVMHPEFAGASGRTRIKQKFEPTPRPCPQWYPPKWNLQVSTATSLAENAPSERPRRLAGKQLLLSLES